MAVKFIIPVLGFMLKDEKALSFVNEKVKLSPSTSEYFEKN